MNDEELDAYLEPKLIAYSESLSADHAARMNEYFAELKKYRVALIAEIMYEQHKFRPAQMAYTVVSTVTHAVVFALVFWAMIHYVGGVR